MQKLLTFFQQKISMYLPYFKIKILKSCELSILLSFEQLGPVLQHRQNEENEDEL